MKWSARNSPEMVKKTLKTIEVSPNIINCLDENASTILRRGISIGGLFGTEKLCSYIIRIFPVSHGRM